MGFYYFMALRKGAWVCQTHPDSYKALGFVEMRALKYPLMAKVNDMLRRELKGVRAMCQGGTCTGQHEPCSPVLPSQ